MWNALFGVLEVVGDGLVSPIRGWSFDSMMAYISDLDLSSLLECWLFQHSSYGTCGVGVWLCVCCIEGQRVGWHKIREGQKRFFVMGWLWGCLFFVFRRHVLCKMPVHGIDGPHCLMRLIVYRSTPWLVMNTIPMVLDPQLLAFSDIFALVVR